MFSTAPVPRGSSQKASALPDAAPQDGRDQWTPLVTRPKPELASIHPMAMEDFVAYKTHLVLCCREGGLPVLRAVPWSEFGISLSGSGSPPETSEKMPEQSSTTDAECEGPAVTGKAGKQNERPPLRALRQDEVPELPVPAWAMHVVSGANLSFDADVHVCHASSPAHPEQELSFHLPTGELLPPKPLPIEAAEAAKGVNARRLHVRVLAHCVCLRYTSLTLYMRCSGAQ